VSGKTTATTATTTTITTSSLSGGNGRGGIVALIPAYNEERFIGSVILKARCHAEAVIVVDDGSSDGTPEIAEAAGALVLRHAENRGKGKALTTGFRKARELDPRAVVILDADGQHLPEEMPCVVAPVVSGQADIVVGSRYLNGSDGVPRHRMWGHWVFTHFTNRISGVSVTDSQSGFRAFSPRAIEAISFQSNGFSVESEMQFLARECDLRVAEVPITIEYREAPKRSVVAHGLMVLNGILQLAGQHRPLLFFSALGMFLLLAGLGWGVAVVHIYRRAQTLAVGYALISTFLATLGALNLLAGIILHSVRGLLISLLRLR